MQAKTPRRKIGVWGTRPGDCGTSIVLGEGGGDDKRGSGHGQGDKEAGPFVAVVEFSSDARSVEKNDPKEKHEREHQAG